MALCAVTEQPTTMGLHNNAFGINAHGSATAGGGPYPILKWPLKLVYCESISPTQGGTKICGV